MGDKGQPLGSSEVLAKFRNALGFLVRDTLDITITKWKDVQEVDKTEMWGKLLIRFILPRGIEVVVKGYVMKQFRSCSKTGGPR